MFQLRIDSVLPYVAGIVQNSQYEKTFKHEAQTALFEDPVRTAQ